MRVAQVAASTAVAAHATAVPVPFFICNATIVRRAVVLVVVPSMTSARASVTMEVPPGRARSGLPSFDRARPGVPSLDRARSGLPPFDRAQPGVPSLDRAQSGLPPFDRAQPGVPSLDRARSAVSTRIAVVIPYCLVMMAVSPTRRLFVPFATPLPRVRLRRLVKWY